MEEEMNSIILAKIVHCIGDNEAKFICLNEKCECSAFICIVSNCQCRNLHENCKDNNRTQLKNLITAIENQKRPITKEQQDTYELIIGCYDEMISKLSEKKAQFIKFIQNIGISQENLKFAQLINENRYVEITGKQTCQIFYKLQEKPIYLIDYETAQTINQYIKICCSKLQEICISLQSYTRQITDIDSKIINQKHYAQIYKFLDKKHKNCQLLFRGSQNQFKAQNFHEKCDNIPDTLVLILTQFDKIIGGYTPLTWKTSKLQCNAQYEADYSARSFIFSLTLNKKFKVNGYKISYLSRQLQRTNIWRRL